MAWWWDPWSSPDPDSSGELIEVVEPPVAPAEPRPSDLLASGPTPSIPTAPAAQRIDPEMLEAVALYLELKEWQDQIDWGLATPEAAAATVLTALALGDATQLHELCPDIMETIPDVLIEDLGMSKRRMHGAAAMLRWQQAENFARIANLADWSTAELLGVEVLGPSADTPRGEFHIAVEVDGEPAELVLHSVSEWASGWICIDPQPLGFRRASWAQTMVR